MENWEPFYVQQAPRAAMKKRSAQLAALGASVAAAALLPLHATSAQAAVFNFQFDTTPDGTVTPPIAGVGTFSFDGPPVAGTFSLTSLPNYDFEFFFAGGTTFTTADITTPVANVEVAISLLGSDFSVNFGGSGGGEGSGSIDFNNGGNELSFQPDFGSLYRLNESIGTYQGITPVPGPLPLLGAGAAFGWSRKIRKRIKSSRPEVIPTSTV